MYSQNHNGQYLKSFNIVVFSATNKISSESLSAIIAKHFRIIDTIIVIYKSKHSHAKGNAFWIIKKAILSILHYHFNDLSYNLYYILLSLYLNIIFFYSILYYHFNNTPYISYFILFCAIKILVVE